MTSNESNVFKRAKLDSDADPANSKSKTIATHSGTFQADEAMGVWMLQQLEEYQHAKVLRTRDMKILQDNSQVSIVLDVGGVYDHSQLRYDHHQRGYDEYFAPQKQLQADGTSVEAPRCTKLSASGLIYRHYGKQVIQRYYPDLSTELLELAYLRIYDSLLQALDAIDTGVEMAPDGIELRYSDATGLARRVSRLNPRWNEEPAPDPDERFGQAVQLCGADFVAVMASIVESDLPARSFVARAVEERTQVDESGQIIQFPSGGLPWKRHLYELEKEMTLSSLIQFVLYTDQAGMWRVQAVTVEGTLFENRCSLLEAWRGLRDEELVKVCQIPGARFVHAAGFIGGADTYEAALEMARATLRQATK